MVASGGLWSRNHLRANHITDQGITTRIATTPGGG